MNIREKHKFICEEDYPVVETKQGKLRGFVDGDIFCFRGISYAKAKRFGMPEEPDDWEGILDATNYGYGCPEMSYSLKGKAPDGDLLCPRRFWNMSENCQNLNIWTRGIEKGRKRPVMVWFHGGGFAGGSSTQLFSYEGWEMSHNYDVVIVTVNHRLNMLGFFDLSDYGEAYTHSGNAGMADLVASLKWVKENIEAFGGDPENVTIYGQSGGGGKVTTLMQMPSADGLFHRAIIQSGIMKAGEGPANEDSKASVRRAVELLGLGKDSIGQIETMDFDLVAQAVMQAWKEAGKSPYMAWAPTPDGSYYVGSPQTVGFRKENAQIPLIVGSCLAEFNPSPRGNKSKWSEERKRECVADRFGDLAEPLMEAFKEAYPELDPSYASCLDIGVRPAVLEFLDQRLDMAKAPVYNYVFTFESTLYGGMLPGHNGDLHFMFHNALYNEGMCREGVTERVQDAMAGAWAQFAYSGNPNKPGAPTWEAYSRENQACMTFGSVVGTRCGHDRKLRDLTKDVKEQRFHPADPEE